LNLGIAGAGLIGGSIGLRAAALGWEVRAWDPDAANLRTARERGAAGSVAGSLSDLAGWSGVLILSAPLEATLAGLAELAALASTARLPPAVFDVASVKVPVARAGTAVPGFVATHPIAGSERSGPAAAHAGLFAGRVWTYDADAPAAGRERARDFIGAMGARPLAVPNGEHDRIVALTSHLPQLVSVALGAQLAPAAADETVAALCGTGIASMLRLAGSSWTMWRAILEANALPISQEVRRLAAILSDVAEDLESGAAANLAGRFEAAAAAAARLGANVTAVENADPGIRT
jgi:prephenate dehydrogenase